MYTPPPFKPDRAACLAFAQTRGFGLFCASDGARPIASSLPFALKSAADGTPQIAFHVARGNPLARLADGARRIPGQPPALDLRAVFRFGIPVRRAD